MATVRKRSWKTPGGESREAWRVRYVDQHGRSRTKQFELKRDAEVFRIKAEGEVVTGTHTADSTSVTVAEAARLRIATAKANCRDRGTIKAYDEQHRLHINPDLGKLKLSRLTPPRVEEFKDKLLLTRSAAMTHKAVRELSMVLRDAMRRGLVAQNAAAGVVVRRSKRDKKRIVIPPPAHLKAMIEAADRLGAEDPRLPVMVRVATFAGLRQSELRAFPWNEADLKGSALEVSQRADRWNAIDAPKSEAGARRVPIGPGLVSVLRAWKLRCPPSELNLMFPAARGGLIDQKGMAALILAVQVEAGLAIDTGKKDAKDRAVWAPRYGWHCLRHACASAWIKQKIDLKRLQTWIGHATIQLTLDTYGHLIADPAEDAALALGAEQAALA